MVLSPARRQQQLRLAIASSLFHGVPLECPLPRHSSPAWGSLITWLDTSGLALPFFAHLQNTGQLEQLPAAVQQRLAKNLKDNTARMNAMADQVSILHRAFTTRNVEYALLKGLSLWPHSVPRLELRSQLDVDFLVSPATLPEAQAALAEQGFHLQARCGASYEYKTEADPPRTLAELYSDHPCRSVELHAANTLFRSAALSCREAIARDGEVIPVLAPCDLFLGQARHLYKHLCSPCFRAAHLLELAHHIRFRAAQEEFWQEIRAATEKDPAISFQLAFCVRFLEQCAGTVVPGPLSCWTSDRLPGFVTIWIERYATRLLTQDFPGSKLYLLLQYEAGRRATAPRSRGLRKALLPFRPPPYIVKPSARDSLRVLLRKLSRQAIFILCRFRFHLTSGAMFILELPRWRRSVRK